MLMVMEHANLIGYGTAPMGAWYVLLSSSITGAYYWLEWGGVNWVITVETLMVTNSAT